VIEVKINMDEQTWGNIMTISHNGVVIETHSDQMEAEDVTFNRDLSWVKTAIEDAYSQGHEDGRLS
jgi:hypothetical protein